MNKPLRREMLRYTQRQIVNLLYIPSGSRARERFDFILQGNVIVEWIGGHGRHHTGANGVS